MNLPAWLDTLLASTVPVLGSAIVGLLWRTSSVLTRIDYRLDDHERAKNDHELRLRSLEKNVAP